MITIVFYRSWICNCLHLIIIELFTVHECSVVEYWVVYSWCWFVVSWYMLNLLIVDEWWVVHIWYMLSCLHLMLSCVQLMNVFVFVYFIFVDLLIVDVELFTFVGCWIVLHLMNVELFTSHVEFCTVDECFCFCLVYICW